MVFAKASKPKENDIKIPRIVHRDWALQRTLNWPPQTMKNGYIYKSLCQFIYIVITKYNFPNDEFLKICWADTKREKIKRLTNREIFR